MSNLWKCQVCGKDSTAKEMLVDDNVFNSPIVQYGCPNCRNMNCMELVQEPPPKLNG